MRLQRVRSPSDFTHGFWSRNSSCVVRPIQHPAETVTEYFTFSIHISPCLLLTGYHMKSTSQPETTLFMLQKSREKKSVSDIVHSTTTHLNNSRITDLSSGMLNYSIVCKSISVCSGLFSHYFQCVSQLNICAAGTEGRPEITVYTTKCNLQSSAHYCAAYWYILLRIPPCCWASALSSLHTTKDINTPWSICTIITQEEIFAYIHPVHQNCKPDRQLKSFTSWFCCFSVFVNWTFNCWSEKTSNGKLPS